MEDKTHEDWHFAQATLPPASLPALRRTRRPGPPAGQGDHSLPARRHAGRGGPQLAQKLGDQLGQPFVVENRPGGNGTIGADAVSKAPADGYTLLFNASTFVSAPMTMKSVPYGVVKDFQPVALVAKAPLSVAINKNLPITDIKSLLAYAKANPGKMTFAVGSIGSAGHLSTELLKRSRQHRLHRGAVQGHGARFPGPDRRPDRRLHRPHPRLAAVPQERLLRVVAVTSSTRAQPAGCADRGRDDPGYRVLQLVRPVGPGQAADADITQRLNAEVNKALAGDMREKFSQQGLLLTPGSVDDFAKFQAATWRGPRRSSPKAISVSNEAGRAPWSRAAARASAWPSPGRCSTDGWQVCGFDVGACDRIDALGLHVPRRRPVPPATERAVRVQPAHVRRSSTPPACCAWARSARWTPKHGADVAAPRRGRDAHRQRGAAADGAGGRMAVWC
jgi:tripartite-type tricarboxylate transporter receptor subunit TctC